MQKKTVAGILSERISGQPGRRISRYPSDVAWKRRKYLFSDQRERLCKDSDREKDALHGTECRKQKRGRGSERNYKYLEEENKRRGNVSAAGVEDQSGEAGIFCISKSELLENAKDYIQGNRIIFGSISIVLLMAGVTNYLNIVVTGILSRKKELGIMESVGMTKRQKRMLFMMEGGYYFCAVTVLLVTIGSVMLQWIKTYNGNKTFVILYFNIR